MTCMNSCGFPDGPDCQSLGEGANGLEQFADDGCCLLPFRCGNGDGGERCERVSVNNGNGNAGNANNDNAGDNEADVEDEVDLGGIGAGTGNNNNNNNGNNNDSVDSGDNASTDDDQCGFPNGPDCESLGEGANGLEQFADDGCCLLPFRCGNGDGGERCERVSVNSANTNKIRGTGLKKLRTRRQIYKA